MAFVSEQTIKDILADDLKQVEKRYNRQLDSLALDNEKLVLKLKNKDREYDKLNREYKTQQVYSVINHIIRLIF